MRIIHLADLHIGKRFSDLSLVHDQEKILGDILDRVTAFQAEAVLISGDIYDKAQPSAEAVQIFDRFLTALRKIGPQVFIIAGNHDSPTRLSYGCNLLEELKIHVVGRITNPLSVFTLEDAYGPCHFILIPYFRVFEVKALWPEETQEMETYDQAFDFLLDRVNLPAGERKVLLAHQHFSAEGHPSLLSDSEVHLVGGLEALNTGRLREFDYVALGHLHRPQVLGKETIRYAGSPLAYSFSEKNQTKTIPCVSLLEPGKEAEVRLHELTPLRQVREIRGTIEDLVNQAKTESTSAREDFLHVVLLDRERVVNPLQRLQAYYPNILSIELANFSVDGQPVGQSPALNAPEEKDMLDLFADFYELQMQRTMSKDDQILLEEFWTKTKLRAEQEDRV